MYKDWLDKEYKDWAKALQESTVDNFGEHPMVKRMLGVCDPHIFNKHIEDQGLTIKQVDDLFLLTNLGWDFKGNIYRMVYYAQKVLKQNPSCICEIGGGVGQFYAVLRALGYKGEYFIYDLPEVKEFQRKYLDRVTELTGLNTDLTFTDFDYCVSFYALGEFDDELKSWYVENVVKKCPHGLVIWNAHSGASKHVPFICEIQDEYPLTSPENKQLSW